MSFLTQFISARKVGTPLIAVQTPDLPATINEIRSTFDAVEGKETPDPLYIGWDIVRGLYSLAGKASTATLKRICGEQEPSASTNPTEMLFQMSNLPDDGVVIMQNAHLYLEERAVIQAISNLRDIYKKKSCTLVLLGITFTLPPELQDILLLDQPLPDSIQLETIVKECFETVSWEKPSPQVLTEAIEAISGLSSFTAEQVVMMALNPEKKELDITSLWERKRQAIEQTPGLTVWRGGETFDDIGGVENAKAFLSQIMQGNDPPNVILHIDEIEKALAGNAGDLSGTTQELLGTQLSWMEDKNVTGIIAIGPPGCTKSMIAKALGNTFKRITVRFDFSAMKGSLVGESNRNLRQALKVVDAISGSKILCIATCNRINSLPPELRRRFAFGTFFFDLPDVKGRSKVWEIWLQKFGLDSQDLPNDQGWTPAEIRQCCNVAWRLRLPLKVAASYIVPVYISAKEEIESLRRLAENRFISSSYPGVYKYSEPDAVAAIVPIASGAARRRVLGIPKLE